MPTVLITGASRGFGRQLLDVYSRRGWDTFPLIRDKKVAQEIKENYGPTCHPIHADVSSNDVASIIETNLAKLTNTLDVLINNAGQIKKHRGLQNTTTDDLNSLFNTHCIGIVRCVKATLPFLGQSQKPVIVNISSRWGSISRTTAGLGGGIYSYQIAKSAQNMLTACLDAELRGNNIRVLAVHPGKLKTEAGAADADTDPEFAAVALADWIAKVDINTHSGLYDLINNAYIDW